MLVTSEFTLLNSLATKSEGVKMKFVQLYLLLAGQYTISHANLFSRIHTASKYLKIKHYNSSVHL